MLDWSSERYVRVYVRDTGDLLAVGWTGRALLWELMRKVDRVGVLDETDPDVIAAIVRMPPDVVREALPKLVDRGVVEVVGATIIVRNFLDAQEATLTPRARQRKFREKRRAVARLGTSSGVTKRDRSVTKRDTDADDCPELSRNSIDKQDLSEVTKRDASVTKRDASVTKRDQTVTGGHAVSRGVTPYRTVPYCTKPKTTSSSSELDGESSEKTEEHDSDDEPKADEHEGKATVDTKAKRTAEARKLADRFVAYLNRVAGRRHRVTAPVVSNVRARLADGASPDDFKLVVDSRWREWRGTDFEKFMRPSTLLQKSKFAEYVEAASATSSKPAATATPPNGQTWNPYPAGWKARS